MGTATLNVLTVSPLAEDHRSLRDIFGHSNWRLFTAYCWREAGRVLSEQEVTLVLCNEEGPEGHWTDFFDAPEIEPHRPGFIVFSKHADDRLWAEAISCGALDVLAKPFDTVEVLRVISGAARQVNHQPARKLTAACA